MDAENELVALQILSTACLGQCPLLLFHSTPGVTEVDVDDLNAELVSSVLGGFAMVDKRNFPHSPKITNVAAALLARLQTVADSFILKTISSTTNKAEFKVMARCAHRFMEFVIGHAKTEQGKNGKCDVSLHDIWEKLSSLIGAPLLKQLKDVSANQFSVGIQAIRFIHATFFCCFRTTVRRSKRRTLGKKVVLERI